MPVGQPTLLRGLASGGASERVATVGNWTSSTWRISWQVTHTHTPIISLPGVISSASPSKPSSAALLASLPQVSGGRQSSWPTAPPLRSGLSNQNGAQRGGVSLGLTLVFREAEPKRREKGGNGLQARPRRASGGFEGSVVYWLQQPFGSS